MCYIIGRTLNIVKGEFCFINIGRNSIFLREEAGLSNNFENVQCCRNRTPPLPSLLLTHELWKIKMVALLLLLSNVNQKYTGGSKNRQSYPLGHKRRFYKSPPHPCFRLLPKNNVTIIHSRISWVKGSKHESVFCEIINTSLTKSGSGSPPELRRPGRWLYLKRYSSDPRYRAGQYP